MSSNGNIFRVTGSLWGESNRQQLISLTKAMVLWCFLWCVPEQTVEQSVNMPVICDITVMALQWLWVRQNMNKSLYSQNISLTLPWWVSNEMYFVMILETIDHVIVALFCISQYIWLMEMFDGLSFGIFLMVIKLNWNCCFGAISHYICVLILLI